MRNLLYALFCVVLVLGVGCAVTDYETITDNQQFLKTKDCDDDKSSCVGPGPGAVVDTKGKAWIKPSGQVALIWSDGTDNLLWFVDQKDDGARKIYTYNHFAPNDTYPTFVAGLFCDPNYKGCAVWKAEDSATCDPAEGGCVFNAQFDGKANVNCLGYRSLTSLLATTRYYGECGNKGSTASSLSNPALPDRMAFVNSGEYGTWLGMEGLFFFMDHNNTTINAGGNIIPMADAELFIDPRRRVGGLNLSNPMLAASFRAFDDAIAAGQSFTLSVSYNGVQFDRELMLRAPLTEQVNRHF
jgi:hypothetical protein